MYKAFGIALRIIFSILLSQRAILLVMVPGIILLPGLHASSIPIESDYTSAYRIEYDPTTTLHCPVASQLSQGRNNPGSIGLTLSGGGARGLAHIGVLHVIDSAGLRIDYINGTSMGSIVGGMYAAGYSASEIEEFALTMDWNSQFGRFAELDNVHIRHRWNFERNIIELPFEEGSFQIKTGVIEGQHLWNTLYEIFFHVRHLKDFESLRIPFSCVATDIENGDAVIMKSGDLVKAIRASIAIPAVFTTVARDGRKLVDGGVANNFPVDVIKDMGAEFVIGVNVSQGLRPAEALYTPIDIIYQMGFFQNNQIYRANREIVDMFLEPDLDEFTIASFENAREIIEQGKKIARVRYADFVSLAKAQQTTDKENQLLENTKIRREQKDLSRHTYLVVDSVNFNGLEKVRTRYIRNLAGINTGDTLNAGHITTMINRFFSTGYFSRINYDLIKTKEEGPEAVLSFNFYENSFSKISASLHYNSFLGVGLIGELSTSKFLLYNLSADIRTRIGEKPAIYAGFDFFTNERQRAWINSNFSADYFSFDVYEDFEAVSRYKQGYSHFETTINRLTGRRSYISGGALYYFQSLTPGTRSDFIIEGRNKGYRTFINWKMYSLNRHAFPQRGHRGSISASWFFNQKPALDITDESGNRLTLQDIGINIGNFLQAGFNWESYIPINMRLTSFTHFQGGYNFNYEQGFINMFNIGGIDPFLRDQVTFAGLNEYSIMTKSVFYGGIGWQYNVWDRLYLTPKLNAAVFDFEIDNLVGITRDNLITGTALDLGFLTAAGPLKATFSYSPKTNRILGFVNFGWSF
jgi:NTE family protein